MGTARGLSGNTRALKRQRGSWKHVQGYFYAHRFSHSYQASLGKTVVVKDGLVPSDVRNAMNNSLLGISP